MTPVSGNLEDQGMQRRSKKDFVAYAARNDMVAVLCFNNI
jgi:hypothetical protein